MSERVEESTKKNGREKLVKDAMKEGKLKSSANSPLLAFAGIRWASEFGALKNIARLEVYESSLRSYDLIELCIWSNAIIIDFLDINFSTLGEDFLVLRR